MTSSAYRSRDLSSINNENPIKNIKTNAFTNRKHNALKVLTNTVQSTQKTVSGNKGLKQLKVLPMKNFETEVKTKSPSNSTIIHDKNDEFGHFGCITEENDFLSPSMTCNIGMLSDFFSSKNDDKCDWFIEDFNNIMNHKIQKTFEEFGEPEVDHSFLSLPPMPELDFPEIVF